MGSHPSDAPGRVFLAERYLPGLDRATADRVARGFLVQIQAICTAPDASATSCTFVPAEQSVLCVVRAESAEIVDVAGRRAGLVFDRIVEAESVGGREPQDLST
jgi:hypothetical protein